jgi:phosphohistidine phosphatase
MEAEEGGRNNRNGGCYGGPAMDVYLIQHGLAASEEQDPRRPLTEHGRAAVAKVARYLAELRGQLVCAAIPEIWHSGKLRAQQTAEVFAQALRPPPALIVRSGMNPNDDPRPLSEELSAKRERPGSLMLVGHLPHLARLAGALLTGDDRITPVQFVNAGVVRIVPAERSWSVAWYLTPTCVP